MITCPGCTLLCDDIQLGAQDPSSGEGLCSKGKVFFEADLPTSEQHFVKGEPVDLETALQAATSLLSQSKAPLICELEHLSTQAQQAAWKAADLIGATIDTTTSNGNRSSMFALQRIGKVTASLGEIRNRSDVAVFWFCDPIKTHPRFHERVLQADCQTIVIDSSKTETAQAADKFIQLATELQPNLLSTIRAKLAQIELDDYSAIGSVNEKEIDSLVDSIRSATYGSLFFGQSNEDSVFDLTTDLIHQLLRQLNDHTRFVGMKLRKDSNALSAENVLSWSSGYPFAIGHATGRPMSNWLEHSSATLLARGECDCVMYSTGLGSTPTSETLAPEAKEHWASIPRIALSPSPQANEADVVFCIGAAGINGAGDYCRNDNVAIGLEPVQQETQSAKKILEQIQTRLAN